MTSITVRAAARDELLDLRHRVLRPGKPRATAYFPGDDEPTTRHYAAVREGVVVGCATLVASTLDGAPAWQLRAMATAPELRGQGVGRRLLEGAAREVAATGVRQFWCNARTSAVSFYARLGWIAYGDEFDIPEIGPHFKMRWQAALHPGS